MRPVWCLIVLLIAAGAAWSQDTPATSQDFTTIYLANQVVARIRGAGPYASMEERAKAVNAAIDKAIASHDVTQPNVTVQQKDGLWWVYAWDTPVISVCPSEASANKNISPKSLAAMWAQSLKTALPMSKSLGSAATAAPAQPSTPPTTTAPPTTEPATGPSTEEPATAEPTAEPAGPSEPVTGSAPLAVVAPPSQPTTGAAPATGGPVVERSAAMLLILDSFRVIRSLQDDEYQSKRDEIASNLLANLAPFVAGAKPAVAPQPRVVVPKPTPGTTVKPAPPIVVKPTPAPSTGATASAPTGTAKPGSVAGVPTGKENDPSYTRVAQKVRIRNKLAQAQDPYSQLKQSDPEAAKSIGDLLKQTRDAFAAGRFDDAEAAVDQALSALGVTPSQ